MKASRVFLCLGVIAFLSAQTSPSQEKQVLLEVRICSVTSELLQQVGAEFLERQEPSARQLFERLARVRDRITDIALSDQLTVQVAVIAEPTDPARGAKRGKPKLAISGVDKDGVLRVQLTPDFADSFSIRCLDLGKLGEADGKAGQDAEAGRAGDFDFSGVGALADPAEFQKTSHPSDGKIELLEIPDAIERLDAVESIREKLLEELKKVIDLSKSDPTEENRRIAELARKSIQTAVYQRGVLDNLRRMLRDLDLTYVVKDDVMKITTVDDVPEDSKLRPLMRNLERSAGTLATWEESRRKFESERP